MRAALLALAALGGCGRIGFSADGDAGSRDGAAIVDARAFNVAFATSQPMIPSFGGLAGADAACTSSATSSNLPGHFVAWLSTSTTNAATRFQNARGWVRPDGKPVVDQLSSLLGSQPLYPLRLDEYGSDLGPLGNHDVFTGTLQDGTDDTSYTQCTDWTVTSGSADVGDFARGANDWTDYATDACTATARLYCFQVDHDNPLPAIPPPSGRIAFVSQPNYAPGNGVAGADSECASEALAAGLTGTFQALLSTTTQTAASRFNATLGPWYRIDGIQLAATGQALMASLLDAPIDLDGSATLVADVVWTGATTPNALATSGDDCTDWTSNASTDQGHLGESESSTAGFDSDDQACNVSGRVYCLQD